MRQAQLCFGLLPKLLYAYPMRGRPCYVLRPVCMRATFVGKRECATKQWSHFLFLHLFKKNCLNQSFWSHLVWCKNQKCNKTKQSCCIACYVLFVCHVLKLSWLHAQIRSVTSVALSILWMTHTNRRCNFLIWFVSCWSSPSICGHGPKESGGRVGEQKFIHGSGTFSRYLLLWKGPKGLFVPSEPGALQQICIWILHGLQLWTFRSFSFICAVGA